MAETHPEKKQCFISHCSDDAGFMRSFSPILTEHFDRAAYDFFNTYQEERSTLAGEGRSGALRQALRESEIMIAVISDSYLRSPICIAEISSFWFADKPVIPIVFDQDGVDFLYELMGEHVIYIQLSNRERSRYSAQKLLSTLKSRGFIPKDRAAAEDAFCQLFLSAQQARPRRPYIGSGDNYKNIDQYCEQYGISLLRNTSLSPSVLTDRLRGAERIFIAATTGSGLINTLSSEFLPDALARGTDLTVLIPNRYSSYVNDVAEIESPDQPSSHMERFAREFDSAVYNLKDCLRRARQRSPDTCGEIYLGCAGNLVRQTVTLAVWPDRLWGWLSVTIPPRRTVDGTPSFEFSAARDEISVGRLILEHVESIRDLAKKRNMLVPLSEAGDFQAFFLENQAAEEYWKKLYAEAKANSLGRAGEAELIEVAAQHPLRPDGRPGAEFARRLDKARELYFKLRETDTPCAIYIPGSVHCYRGKADPCSLSEAGRAYLTAAGIPPEDLLGEAENRRYKGDQGVYNTADECYVASRIFFDGDYRRLHCVCSPNQIMRKKLFYIAFGVIPYYHTVNSDRPAHDDMYELFHSIPGILALDHTWQGSDSVQGKRTREERDPRNQGSPGEK